MSDAGNGQLRYLIHFSDGGSGMRARDEPLEPGRRARRRRRPLSRRACRAGAKPASVRTRLGGGVDAIALDHRVESVGTLSVARLFTGT